MHTSTAERLAFGGPVDPVADDTRVIAAPLAGSTAVLIGRILMSVIFVLGGVTKLMHVDATVGYMQMGHVPAPGTMVYVVAFAEILGGLSLLLGVLTRLGAIGLFVYLIPVTIMFHAFWAAPPDQAQMQQVNFMKNLAVMGGLLALFAFGPGRFSIDSALRRRADY